MFTTLAPSKTPSHIHARTHPPESRCHWGGKHCHETVFHYCLCHGELSPSPPQWRCRFDAFPVAVQAVCFPVVEERAYGLRHVHATDRCSSAAAPFSLSLLSPVAQLAHTKVIPAASTAEERRGTPRAAASK